jgi:hypothetical protein
LKFFPHQFIGAGVVSQSLDTARLMRWIQRGKIHKFHCNARGRSPEKPGQLDHPRISGVHLPERQRKVLAAYDEKIIA